MSGTYKWLRESLEATGKFRRGKAGTLSYIDSKKKILKVSHTDSETGITTSQDLQLAVVTPTQAYMPTRDDIQIISYNYSVKDVSQLLHQLSGIIAVDIETKGQQAANADCEIVGIGIADHAHILYFDLVTNGKEVNDELYKFLKEYDQGMVGHNIFFDGAFLQRECGKWIGWSHDTYALYKQLANEGHKGQKWGLKDAQLQLLGWDVKGDVQLNEWLVRNGYFTSISKEQENKEQVLIEDFNGKGPRYGRPDKSEMWRAPAEILGFYCALDAASTWQLLHEVFFPSIEGQPWEAVFRRYHDVFVENVRLMVDQQLKGITIDVDMLEAYSKQLEEEISHHRDEFINHPAVRPYADEKNQEKIQEIINAEPVKYKKIKWPKEPKQFKKDGTVSKAYLNWEAKMKELQERGPEITIPYQNWEAKVEEAKKTEWLNPNSSQQLQWLFYDKMEYPIKIRTYGGGIPQPPEYRKDFRSGELVSNPEFGKWLNSNPAVSGKALLGFGDAGQVLKQQKDKAKEESYVKACLDHLLVDAQGNTRLHPQFRMPGTLTCRLAGSGGLNLQQIPKSRGYLECWRPVPGKVWIDCDHTSLEQVVMAELSMDESLYKIYGPDAKPNDIYLFNGAYLPIIGEKIRAAGYDPDNPTPEAIAATKKACKKERGISKVITLGSSYGMGAGKLRMTLEMQGIEVSAEEAKAMFDGYWQLYSGVKDYEKFLLQQYKDNNGYVLNGLGRPVGVAPDYMKDIVNRVVQSTGHDIHMLYIMICNQLFTEHNLNVQGLVWDFHDQSIVECDEKDAELVHYLIGTKAYEILNQEYLQGQIPLKGDPQYIKTFACAKCE